jgi:hypothetical protein
MALPVHGEVTLELRTAATGRTRLQPFLLSDRLWTIREKQGRMS